MTDLSTLAGLAGLISDEIGEALYEIATRVPAEQAIVELGSYHGKSTAYLAAGARDGHGPRVYAVDAWNRKVHAWSRYHSTPTFAQWQTQLTAAGLLDRVTPLRGLTVRRGRTYTGPPVGLLYVDADHAEAAVLADVEAWLPHLASDALVVFDDYDTGRRNPGVLAAVKKLVAAGTLVNVRKVAGRLAVCGLG